MARYTLAPSASGAWNLDFANRPEGRFLAVLESDKSRYSTQFVDLR